MRVAYVVLSHRKPGQLLRLLRALREGPGTALAVRYDPRGERIDERELERLGVLRLRDDLEFEWGGWTQLQVLLGCVERAAAELDPDWLLVLSGQDYPLRPIPAIEARLAESGLDAMLGDAWELDTRRAPAPPEDDFFLRYTYRHYVVPRRAPRIPRRLRPLAYMRQLPPPLPPRYGIRRLRTPFGDELRCFVSADWLTLRRPAIDAVVRAARERRDLMRYYRRVAIPSESFFATVLLNDPSLRVARHNRRFILFPGPLTPHPNTLTSADLDRMLASGCDFARKFDVDVDAEVLDALDDRRHLASPR